MEGLARAVLILALIVSILQVVGVGGQGAARSPSEAAQRIGKWWSAKLFGTA